MKNKKKKKVKKNLISGTQLIGTRKITLFYLSIPTILGPVLNAILELGLDCKPRGLHLVWMQQLMDGLHIHCTTKSTKHGIYHIWLHLISRF